MAVSKAVLAFVRDIISTDAALKAFVLRITANPRFEEERPNAFTFFNSLADYITLRPRFTEKQKETLNRELIKFAEFFIEIEEQPRATLSNANATASPAADNVPIEAYEQDERIGMQTA